MTSRPISCSKARSTASFKNVPPCTTMCWPSSSTLPTRMTLYSAFLTTEMDSPAEMFSMDAPSFCACLTEEFINTVQREPRSTGLSANKPFWAKSSMVYPSAPAKVCRKLPQPEEQASLRNMLSMTPFLILKHLMSCPPMSMMKSTCGSNLLAAVKCAMVSTMPQSAWNAFLMISSP